MGNVTPITSGSSKLRAPRPINETDDCSLFDCGKPDLDEWLRNTAIKFNGRTSRTYVVCDGSRVAAYYCLAAGSVLRKDLPNAKTRKGMPPHVPVIVAGRLAVDKKYQGNGIGSALLKDAIFKSIEASRQIGVRAIIVHAIDLKVVPFYLDYGFLPSPHEQKTLFLPIETAIKALEDESE